MADSSLLVAPRADIPIVIGRDVKNGPVTLDANFSRMFLLPLYARAGGMSAMTNLELAAAIQALSTSVQVLAVAEMVLQPAQAQQAFADVMQDAPCDCLQEMTFQ